MKQSIFLVGALAFSLSLVQLPAQFGPRGGGAMGPKFDAAMNKLFGDNSAFSATLEFQIKNGKGDPMNMPGKMAFSEGKSRFEMNMAALEGGKSSPQAAAQMAAMGMDKMIAITRPDKKSIYMVIPGMKAYATTEMKDAKDPKAADSFKLETTELGKETVDGHPCVKNKVVVTDDQGTKHESTVWNATDLKKFPVKIETTERDSEITMLFKEIQLAKPANSLFDPPAEFKSYDSLQALMQEEMMKRMGGPGGFAPPPHEK